MPTRPKSGPTMFGRFILVLAIAAILPLAIVLPIYQARTEVARRTFEGIEKQSLVQTADAISDDFFTVASDIRFLAHQNELQALVDRRSTSNRRNLAEVYAVFAASKGIYGLVRYLDQSGKEVVRVGMAHGKPVIAPDSALQDKSDRYYFKEGSSLSPGQIYVSRFDLNIERGQVEQPPKPVIRVAEPVFDRHGQRQGLVILNYLGSGLIERAKRVARNAKGQVWLIDSQGYWLIGPKAEDEWGFMYPERKERSFAHDYPREWARIRQSEEGQFRSPDGALFTYERVDPFSTFSTAVRPTEAVGRMATPYSWTLVSYASPSVVEANMATGKHLLAIGYAVYLVLAAIAAWAWSAATGRRRTAERAMAESRQRYAGLVSNLPMGVYRKTAGDDNRFVEVNPAMLRILEADSKEQLLGAKIADFYADPAARKSFTDRLLAEGQVDGEELDLVTLKGRRFYGEISAVKRQDTDGSIYFDGTLSDVTARRDMEKKIRESEARFRAFLETAPDAVVVVDSEGTIVLVNAKTEQLFDYGRSELLGRPVEMLVPEANRAGHRAHRADYVRNPKSRAMGVGLELSGRKRDGTLVAVEVSLSPVLVGDSNWVISIVRDVSARRIAEQEIRDLNQRLSGYVSDLQVLNRELEAFSYSVSHDLRAPLRSIDGFSQALLEDYHDQLDETGKDYLSRVRGASQRMAALIDDLLRLSRITRAEMKCAELDLTAMSQQIVDGLRQSAPDRRLEIEIQPGMTALGDVQLLRIALENLIGNAWKFTGKQPDARLQIGQLEGDEGKVYFVRDNGAGFDMAYADKLFGAFQRLHSTQEFDGTGIGLATVQRIIHRHGGRVWAESSKGNGATFYFTLGKTEGETKDETQRYLAGGR